MDVSNTNQIFYCKGNAVLINYVESMKDSVVVGLRCLLFCRKLVKRENIVTENLIKNHNIVFEKTNFANLYMNSAILENFAINMILFKYK